MQRLLLALLALACLGAPAWADVPLTTWTKIANQGTTVQIQCRSTVPCVFQVIASMPSSNSYDGGILNGGEGLPFGSPLPNDLYARSLGDKSTIAVNPIGVSGSGGTVSTVPGAVTLTTTNPSVTGSTVTGGGSSSALLLANTSRKFLFVMNTGSGACNIGIGVTASATVGEPLAPGSGSGTINQGGSKTMEASAISRQAVTAYCTAPSTFTVEEGQ